MSDDDALQGYWRIESYIVDGEECGESATHYHFDRGRFRRVAAHWFDDGKPGCTYRLNESANQVVFEDPENDNPIGLGIGVSRALYRIENDRLVVCFGEANQFPSEISPRNILTTLDRERGPAPQMRKPSGKQSLADPALGTFPWSDVHGQYQGRLPLSFLGRLLAVFRRQSRSPSLSVEENESGDIAPALTRARTLVAEFAERERGAREYAVLKLLPLKNEDWLGDNERPVTAQQFRSRMTLDGVSVHGDGRVTFCFRDGDLFWGHWIVVEMNSANEFVDADIPG